MEKHDIQYMKIAKIWAENSHARRNKVGAIIVKDNMIISDGYNGMPAGFDNECEYEEITHDFDGEGYYSDYARLVTKPEVLHAEANAITKLAKSTQSSDGATLYVTLSPCLECAKLIIQSGIKRVVYGEVYRSTSGLELLEKAGITLEKLNIE